MQWWLRIHLQQSISHAVSKPHHTVIPYSMSHCAGRYDLGQRLGTGIGGE